MELPESIRPEFYEKHKYLFELMHVERPHYPIRWGYEVGKGWIPIIEKFIEKLDEIDTDNVVRIFQIKEKFGTLRLYLEHSTKEAERLVDAYETMANFVCEECGAPGEYRGGLSWVQTLCDDCYEKARNK